MLNIILIAGLPLYTDYGGTIEIHIWHVVFWLFVFGAAWQCLRTFFLTKWLIRSIENLLLFVVSFVLDKGWAVLSGGGQMAFDATSRTTGTLWQHRLGKLFLLSAVGYAAYNYSYLITQFF